MTPQEAQALSKYLIKNIEQELPVTRKILAAVPEQQLGFRLGNPISSWAARP